MARILFDFSIRPETIARDHAAHDISMLDDFGVRCLADGRIFIIFESQREFIVIESEVIDYLSQMNFVLSHIDCGNRSAVTVSGDYYSNCLQFSHEPNDGTLLIKEGNGGVFAITIAYGEFNTQFRKFYDSAINDLLAVYPELTNNEAFRNIVGRL